MRGGRLPDRPSSYIDQLGVIITIVSIDDAQAFGEYVSRPSPE